MTEKGESKEAKIMFPLKMERIAFGVRYEPQYSVLDSLGSAIDNILRYPRGIFNADVFPRSQNSPNEHILLNPDTKDALRINQQDAILDFHADTRDFAYVQSLSDAYSQIVLRALRETCKVKSIVRYGALLRFEECHSSLSETPAQMYLGADFPSVRALSLRFSRRLPTLEGVTRRGVDDFRNVNYIVDQQESGAVTIAIDYQEYFSPALNPGDWAERPFSTFAARSIEYFEGEFSTWLKKMYRPAEVA